MSGIFSIFCYSSSSFIFVLLFIYRALYHFPMTGDSPRRAITILCSAARRSPSWTWVGNKTLVLWDRWDAKQQEKERIAERSIGARRNSGPEFSNAIIDFPSTVRKGMRSSTSGIQLRLFEMETNRLNFCNKLLPISIHWSRIRFRSFRGYCKEMERALPSSRKRRQR